MLFGKRALKAGETVLIVGIGGGGLAARDTNRTSRFRDDYLQGGGFIRKDRLWWFGAIRDRLSTDCAGKREVGQLVVQQETPHHEL